MAKKKTATKKAAESLYDLKEEIVEEVKAPVQPASFKSLKAAKAYAKANGGKVVEKGKFYVR
jgi:hypothetical protein